MDTRRRLLPYIAERETTLWRRKYEVERDESVGIAAL